MTREFNVSEKMTHLNSTCKCVIGGHLLSSGNDASKLVVESNYEKKTHVRMRLEHVLKIIDTISN